jgi:hypothetical protein
MVSIDVAVDTASRLVSLAVKIDCHRTAYRTPVSGILNSYLQATYTGPYPVGFVLRNSAGERSLDPPELPLLPACPAKGRFVSIAIASDFMPVLFTESHVSYTMFKVFVLSFGWFPLGSPCIL